MKRILAIAMLIMAGTTLAEISGPTTSSSGNFTLQWDTGESLWEVDGSGNILNTWTGGSVNLTRSYGTYLFWDLACGWVPFFGYLCYPDDEHQITVTSGGSGTPYPEPVEEQAQYGFLIRSGDLDGNGKTDLFVERLDPVPIDGSLQSYIVWNNSNGTISTSDLTPAYSAIAQSAPINQTLSLMPTDVNADGYADHILAGIDDVMGASFENELVIYAPGVQVNKVKPQGHKQVDQNYRSFLLEIAQWMNDQNYFANNIQNTQVYLYSWYIYCDQFIWSEGIPGFLAQSFCYPHLYVTGSITVQYGINFDALAVTSHMETAANNGELPSEFQLWQISQIANSVIGSHLFGFDSNGNRHETNHANNHEGENILLSYLDFLFWAARSAKEVIDDVTSQPHDYEVGQDFPLCSTDDEWCTLENVACWGRIFHAPFKNEGYDNPATNGGEYVLHGAGDDPILTGVGQAAGLPENAIANITLPDHILHNPEMGGWPTCPQSVPDEGTGTPPPNCNQIYREPYIKDGNIHMRTRGTGENNFDFLNEKVLGPYGFETLDEKLKEAMDNAPDHECPNL